MVFKQFSITTRTQQNSLEACNILRIQYIIQLNVEMHTEHIYNKHRTGNLFKPNSTIKRERK